MNRSGYVIAAAITAHSMDVGFVAQMLLYVLCWFLYIVNDDKEKRPDR